MPKLYTTKPKNREAIAENTIAVYFEKPADFSFIAGQYTDLILPPPEGVLQSELKRDLSIASAPHEENLVLAVRLGPSLFKKTLASMPIGTEVTIKEAHGSFTLHKDASIPAVFIAGGIGVTPFRGMILDALHRKTGHAITLFYSSNTPEETAFFGELQNLERENKNFKMTPTMTGQGALATWDGETGLIDADMIKRYVENLNVPIYYIAGSPDMVFDMRNIILGLGASEEHIKEEQFTGY